MQHVANAINNASHKVTTETTDIQAVANTNTTTIKTGETLKIEAGKNLVSQVDETGKKVLVSTAKEVEFDKVTVGDASIDKDDGINAGNKQIKDVASGGDINVPTNEKNAANIGDLKAVSKALTNKGLVFKGDDATAIEKKLGETLESKGGADENSLTENNIGVNSDGQNLHVKLAKDIKDLDSVVLGTDASDKDTVALT
ncbi:MAG: hypothetical protein CR960_02475, partial [Pasteurellales bacterium]